MQREAMERREASMASGFDFTTGVISSPVLDRVQRGQRIHDNLPRRRFQVPDKPDRKSSGDTLPEDAKASREDETEKRRIDLRA